MPFYNRYPRNSTPSFVSTRAYIGMCVRPAVCETREWKAGNLKAIGRGGRGGRQFWARGAHSPLPLSLWLALAPRQSETRARRKFLTGPRVSLSPSPPIYLRLPSVSFSFTLPLPRSNEPSSSGAHHTTHSGKGLCVSQRVRVISRLERLQVREEAANV